MNVLVVEPGIIPYEKEVNGHEEMKAVVGGPIDTRYFPEEGITIVANENAILSKEHFNRSFGENDGIFGTFFICGDNESGFYSLTPEQAAFYGRKFYYAEMLLGSMSGKWVVMKVEPKRKPAPRRNRRPPKPPRR